jgi:hypothetical protein
MQCLRGLVSKGRDFRGSGKTLKPAGFVTGHHCRGCGKTPDESSFVTRHDFSRAARDFKTRWASALEGWSESME